MAEILTADGNVGLAPPLHVYKNAPLTASGAAAFAPKVRLISVGAHPFLSEELFEHVIEYTKTNQTNDGSLPEGAYSHLTDPKHSRRVDRTWNVYAMEPSSRDWFNAHRDVLRAVRARNRGIFSDSAGRFSFDQGTLLNGKHWPVGMPPDWTRPYALPIWLSAIGANIEDWMTAFGGLWAINGLSADTINIYPPTVGMIENAFKSASGKLPDEKTWTDTYTFLGTAQAKDWTPWVYVKLHSWTPELATQWRNLMAPTMLLADVHSLLFDLGGKEGSQPPYVTGEYDSPMYRPGIGKMTTRYEIANVHVGEFESGVVIVNPTAKDVTLSEGPWGNPILIPHQQGTILKGTFARKLENRSQVK